MCIYLLVSQAVFMDQDQFCGVQIEKKDKILLVSRSGDVLFIYLAFISQLSLGVFEWDVLMVMPVFEKLRGSWLEGLAVPLGVRLIARFGVRKAFFHENRLASMVEGFAFLCSLGHSPFPLSSC